MSSIGGSTNLIRTSAIAGTTPTIPTLLAERSEANFDVNHWGYRFDTGNYLPFDGEIEDYSHAYTSVNDADTTRTITFAAKIDKDQTFGTYELGLIFTATARPTTQDFIVNYDSGVSTIVIKQSLNSCDPAVATGETNACPIITTITNSNPGTASGAATIPGLGNGIVYYLIPSFVENMKFLSWANDQDSVGTLGTPDAETGVVSYTVGDQEMLRDVNSVSLTSQVNGVKLNEATYLQDAISCENTASGTGATLLDKRDNKSYSVGKLYDGNCWLLDNLQLELDTVSLDNLKGNTNADDASLTYLKNGGGVSPYTTAAVVNTSSFGIEEDAYIAAKIYKNGMNDNYSYGGSATGKRGIYYNYCAASAGSYCYASSSSPDGANATQDICPSGWHMPTGDTANGSYYSLRYSYIGLASKFIGVFRVPFAGYLSNKTVTGQGSKAQLWSSSRYNESAMYNLYVDNADGISANPQSLSGRSYGFSVRCVAD